MNCNRHTWLFVIIITLTYNSSCTPHIHIIEHSKLNPVKKLLLLQHNFTPTIHIAQQRNTLIQLIYFIFCCSGSWILRQIMYEFKTEMYEFKPTPNVKVIAHLSCKHHLSGGFLLFFSLRSYIVSLFHRLSLLHWDAVFLISWICQWSGDRGVHHVRLASLSYYPEMCGRLQSPVKCQRGALYNLLVQTLPQDTAAVLFCNATK